MTDIFDAAGDEQAVNTKGGGEGAAKADELVTSQLENDTSLLTTEGPLGKKKRKNKVGKTRRAITGFEEFYADPPTTPDEAKEEKKLYAPNIPFPERIEECIQRYRQRRRWDSPLKVLFEKYLALGGVDSSQRMFQGLDPTDIKTHTSDEIREMTARNVIGHGCSGSKFFDPDDPEHWIVDFVAVVKGFLSRWVPEEYPRSDKGSHHDNLQAANLVTNFLNYIMIHDVCPEYNSQILTARAICDAAPAELQHARDLFYELQDSFNTAARFLFCEGGVHNIDKESVIDGTAPELDFPTQDPATVKEKLDPFKQLVIFRITVMDTTKDQELKEKAAANDPTQIRVINTKTQTYQVISVHRRRKSEKKQLERALLENGIEGQVKPAGTIKLRPSMIDHACSNIPRPDQLDFSKEPTETFMLDDDVLAKVHVGMKMRLQVCELNIGVKFIKVVRDVRVTFDTLLPQSLMLKWKDPVENERPAPSVDSPSSGTVEFPIDDLD